MSDLDFLVLAPPVAMPAEPPAGAFLLAAGLAGHGRTVALLDLSRSFYLHLLETTTSPLGLPPTAALASLRRGPGYAPARHRSDLGSLHARLGRFPTLHPGWRLSLMDLQPPVPVHDPARLANELAREDPFRELWLRDLDPVLDARRPRRVLVSVAYLAQLPAAISLAGHLRRRDLDFTVGGSLPRSLARTGSGIDLLAAVLPNLSLDDGRGLVGSAVPGALLSRLACPEVVDGWRWLAARPIVPLALSQGCHWRRCRFCPDRGDEFARVPLAAVDQFLASLPRTLLDRRPLVHFVDSALPPDALAEALDRLAPIGADAYGFARPTAELLRPALVDLAARTMLLVQLGAESGDERLLARWGKGVRPEVAAEITRTWAAAGVRTYLYLLFGLPDETESEREATVDFLASLGDAVDFLNLSIFNLPRVPEDARQDVVITSDQDAALIRLYDDFTVGGRSPRAEARRFLQSGLDHLDNVRAARRRTPRWLRAAHLAFIDVPGRRPA